MSLSRRTFLATTAAVAVPLPGWPQGADTRRRRLERQLARIEAGMPHARLELRRYEEADGNLFVAVRLRWPPGLRQRPFRVSGQTAEAAFETISANIESYFAALT